MYIVSCIISHEVPKSPVAMEKLLDRFVKLLGPSQNGEQVATSKCIPVNASLKRLPIVSLVIIVSFSQRACFSQSPRGCRRLAH